MILGRPFLATSRAVIDIKEGKLTLRIGDEELVIKMATALKCSMSVDDVCYSIDIIDSLVDEHLEDILSKDRLQLSLTRGEEENENHSEEKSFTVHLDATKEITTQKGFEDLG